MNIHLNRHQQLIQKANESVSNAKSEVATDPFRLGYHVMAPSYWINDPNGVIQFKGEYHLFYQHHPYSPDWGPMHWGHVISKDLVHWEHLPIALAPSEDYDQHGCFSGSAVDDNGILTVIYTGNVYLGEGKRKQIQCVAFSEDGVTYEKYSGNPIIESHPIDNSLELRDPKVWKHDQTWYMVLGSTVNGRGSALLYSSLDLRQWTFKSELAVSDGTQGHFWECPDLFSLGEEQVLIVSPMYQEGRDNIYIVGDMDFESGCFTQKYHRKLDYGLDFYAAQTFLDDQGRRILIGWMDNWGTKMPTKEKKWAGAMTLPRVLSFFPDGELKIQPVPELQKLRNNHKHFQDITVNEESFHVLGDVNGDCLEIMAEFKLEDCNASEFGIKLRCSNDGLEETIIIYNILNKTLSVDRNKSGLGITGVYGGRLEPESDQKIKLHIYLDRSSIEIFGNDGRIAISSRIYPSETSLGVDVFAKEGSVSLISIDIWHLQSVW